MTGNVRPMKPLHAEFARKIKALRESHTPSMTQENLAEKLGVTPDTVSRWERGLKIPPAKTLEKIAKIFAQPVGFFLDQGVELRTVDLTPTTSDLLKVIDSQEKRIQEMQLKVEQAEWKTQQYDRLKAKLEKLEAPGKKRDELKNDYALGVITAKPDLSSKEEQFLLQEFRKLKNKSHKALVFYVLNFQEEFVIRILETHADSQEREDLRNTLHDLRRFVSTK